MGNSGVYFITCECFGSKFVKVGRSSDVATRRRELQTGCPFELVVEYVQPMDEADAIEHERRYRAVLRKIQQQAQQESLSDKRPVVKTISRWFPYTGEIQAFVQELSNGEGSAFHRSERQSLLF